MKTRLLLVALLVVTALAACGKGESKPALSGEPTTSTSEDTSDTTEVDEPEDTGDGEAAELSFVGKEYAYDADAGTDAAAPIPAGEVAITLQNVGEEEHQITIARLREGRTMEDVAGLGANPSQLGAVLETFGGPNGVAPGESGTTTQSLPAGDYLLACFIPAPDGQPHVAKGMLLEVAVEGQAADGAGTPPGEDEKVLALADYEFGFGDDALIETGEYAFTNDGPQPHEVAIYAPAEGATTDDVLDYFSDPAPEGAPPIVGAGGIGPIDPGRVARATIEPGEYVFVCFIPDAGDGAPHFTKGMIQVVNVE